MRKKSHGFTLIEVITALVILVMSVSMALTGYTFLLKKANAGDVQHELDIDVQSCIEWLKKDMRLSSMDEIRGYPEGTPPYKAISFPIAKFDPVTKRIIRQNEKIVWDKMVVYHIVSGDPDKLTKTTYDYDPDADDLLQAQLDYIVENDGPEGDSTIENAESRVIFENLLEWGLDPQGGRFSCYSENPGYETISLGYTLLDDENNQVAIDFKCTGTKGTGYKLGIDQLQATSSLRYREAESRLPDNVTRDGGASPVSDPVSSYGNRHRLLYDAEGPGNSITITFDNDRWEETDFKNEKGYSEHDNVVVHSDPALDDVVVKLEGNEVTWTTSEQCSDTWGLDYISSNLVGATVAIMQKGAYVADGNHISCNGQLCQLTFRAATNSNLKINNIQIGENSDPYNAQNMTYNGTEQNVYFSGASDIDIPAGESRTSDWVDLPINKEKNYIVTYSIIHASEMKMWRDNRAIASGTAANTEIIAAGTSFKTHYLPALESITASYVANGTFTSDIFDTRKNAPEYNAISWKSLIPSDSTLSFKVLSSDDPSLLGSRAFSNAPIITASSLESSRGITETERYIQFQALMSADSSYLETPVLKEIAIDWPGEIRMVNILGKFSTGPDYGEFQVSVDGQPLKSSLVVDLEIYKDINQGAQRVSSAIKAEITPRNSGL